MIAIIMALVLVYMIMAAQFERFVDLLDRVFGGSTESLVLGALSSRPSPPEEIAKIRRFLDEMELDETEGGSI